MKKWYEIKDFPNYELNKLGEVRNVKTKRILKKRLSNGYISYRLYTDGKPKDKRVHRLMMETLNSQEGMDALVVNHKDGDKTNCLFENLEWTTVKGNASHASKTGLLAVGAEHHFAKITEEDAIYILSEYEKGRTISDIVKDKDIYTKSIVEKIAHRQRWKHIKTCND